MKRARFIVIDGADGTGKDTQAPILAEAAMRRGLRTALFRFPEYETATGQDILAYQRGEFGELGSVHPRLACYLYATNRMQAQPRLQETLSTCDLVIAKRYVPSNVVYGASLLPPRDRSGFQAWVERLDYEVCGNPREDAVIYLDLPVDLASTLITQRDLARRDINDEADGFRQTVRNEYLRLAASRPGWHVVDCAENYAVKSIEAIAHEIEEVVFTKVMVEAPSAEAVAA